MAYQALNKGSSANDGGGDTLRAGAQKINENFTEIYAILGGTSLASGITLDATTKGIIFEGSQPDDYETTLVVTEPTADRTITIPNLTGNVVLDTSTNTLVNKTLTSPVLTTPQINDTSANHQYVVAVSELLADRNVTLPLLTGDDEFTFNSHTQTLTNKTLTTPAITSPNITTGINDTNGKTVVEISATANAVNHIKLTNKATNANVLLNRPTLEATGTDNNIGLSISGKGTGLVNIDTGVSFASQTLTDNGDILLTKTTTLFSKNSAFSTNALTDGTVVGQTKVFNNKNSGTVTIPITNFQLGSNLLLVEHSSAILLWDGTEWALISTYLGTVT